MEVREANGIVQMLCAAYPTYPVSTDTVQLYIEFIRDRDAHASAVAARNWIAREGLFPKINELLAQIRIETDRLAPPPAALDAPTRPKLSLEEIRAMRPSIGGSHARHTARRSRHESGTE